MSKNALVALTIVLCVIAAGVGGFFATRTGNLPAAAMEPVAAAPQTPVPADIPPAAAPATAASEAPATAPIAVAAAVAPPVSAAAATPVRDKAPANRPGTSQVSPVKPADPPAQPASLPSAEQPRPETPPVAAATEPPAVIAPPVEPPPPPAAPAPQYEELVVSADSVLGLQLDSTVHSETAKVEDPVDAHVTRNVRVGSMVAIPAGTRVLGVVTQVERGGKMKTKSRLGVRFHTVVLADGTRTTIQTDVVFREGDSPGQEAAGKMGAAAAGGAILGALLGGGKGAAIGGSIGAAGGAAAVMSGGRNTAVLKSGTPITVRLLQPVSVMVER